MVGAVRPPPSGVPLADEIVDRRPLCRDGPRRAATARTTRAWRLPLPPRPPRCRSSHGTRAGSACHLERLRAGRLATDSRGRRAAVRAPNRRGECCSPAHLSAGRLRHGVLLRPVVTELSRPFRGALGPVGVESRPDAARFRRISRTAGSAIRPSPTWRSPSAVPDSSEGNSAPDVLGPEFGEATQERIYGDRARSPA